MLIEAKNIRKDYGGNVVLAGVDFRMDEGEKVGLVGRNGSGKSTLLRILCGQDDDYTGSCILAANRRIALVPQDFPDFAGTAVEFVAAEARDLRARLRGLEEQMADPISADRALAEYGRLREVYDRMDGDGAEDRAERFLESAGLAGAARKPTGVLSGGERNVLALARALNLKPDLLILDEPGNHLDIWGLAWLEAFLAGIPQGVLIVSHNRYLLDRAVTRTVELEGGKAASYAGGWSAYRMERLRKNAAQGMDWKADQKKLGRLEELVKRFELIARSRPDPAWGRRLRARRTQLERARRDAVAKPEADSRRMDLDFSAEVSKADIAIAVSGYRKILPDGRVLFDGAELLVRSGERVALVGPNGSGKTTLLTELVEKGSWDDPVLRIGPSFTVGWCPQHQEIFKPDRTVREEFLRLRPVTEDEVSALLRRFLFGREALDKKIGSLSGGERNRLQLARAIFLKADLLILDEPTNHLDIPAREVIEEALGDFKGTLIIVSHDRYLLDQVADRIVEIDGDGALVSWNGNFSEFWFRAYGTAGATLRKGGVSARDMEDRGRVLRQTKTRNRTARNGAENDRADLEQRIQRLETERSILEHRSADAFKAGDYKTARRLGNELAELTGRIEELYGRWTD